MKTTSSVTGLHRLMAAYVDGDKSAFLRMHAVLVPRLRGFLMKLVHDGATVDDLVQLTLLKAHLARDRFALQGGDPDGAVQAWYFAIARNVALDHLRERQRNHRRQVEPAENTDDPHAAVPSPDAGADDLLAEDERARALVELVREAISRLPPSQQEVVELHKLRGMTMAEIADKLAVREGAIRVRAHRAYRALARMLSPRNPRNMARSTP